MLPDGLLLLLAYPDEHLRSEVRIHWSPDERWLSAADDRHVWLWRVDTWELVDTMEVTDADPTWLDRDTMAIVTPESWRPWTVGHRPGRPRPRPEGIEPGRRGATLIGIGDGRLVGIDGDDRRVLDVVAELVVAHLFGKLLPATTHVGGDRVGVRVGGAHPGRLSVASE